MMMEVAKFRIVLLFAVLGATVLCQIADAATVSDVKQGGLSDSKLPGRVVGDDGWTIVTPAAYSRRVYVSNTQGSDINTGLSENQPLRSLRKAIKLLRADTPDHLLLRRGDVWYETLTLRKQSGRNYHQPVVIASYGDEHSRPVVGGVVIAASHVVVMDLLIDGPGKNAQPDNAGVEIFRGSKDILLENIVVRGCKIGLDIRNSNEVSIRRSMVIDSSKLGMFIENTNDLLVEQTLLDNNGSDKVLEHNIYKSRGGKNLTFRNNLLTRGANCGIKLRAKSENVQIVGNVFSFNACDVSMKLDLDDLRMGRTDWDMRSVHIAGNAFINTGRGKYQNAITAANTRDLVIEKNFFTNSFVAPWTAAIIAHHHADGAQTGIENIEILDNVISNVASEGIRLTVNITGRARVENNIIQLPKNDHHATEAITIAGVDPADIQFADNTYYCDYPKNKWFKVNDQKMSFDKWQALAGDIDSTVKRIAFVDPDRDLASYQQSVGGGDGFQGFIERARQQDRQNWDSNYMATPIIKYIADGLCEQSK